MRFINWAENMSVPREVRSELLEDLLNATPAVRRFLQPTGSTEDDATFTLTEGLVLATQA